MKCPKCLSENVQVHYETERQGFSGKKGCCGWIIFGPIGLLCGLCGKNKIKSEDKYWVCNHCGAKFTDREGVASEPPRTYFTNTYQYNAETNNAQDKDENCEPTPAQLMLDYSNVNFDNLNNCMNCFSTICSLLNGGNNTQSYIRGFNKIAVNHPEWATSSVNADLFVKVKETLSSYLESDETTILYKDGGVFSKGKSGVLITSKKIISMNKDKINIVNFSELTSLHFVEVPMNGGCICYFNSNTKVQVDNMTCNPVEQGMILAFICSMGYEITAGKSKIQILNGNL